MRKLILFIALSAFIFIGCEENFSPKGDFEEKFALTCIVRGDTALQIASIYSSYNVDGYDPSVNEENPAYRNADIRLWYQDTVYIFKDSTVYNSSSPDSLFHFYYLDKFKPTGKGELMEIEATLTNGKRLKSSCFTPGKFAFDGQETSTTIPAVNTPTVNIVWTSEDQDNFYLGRIRVKYFENVNGEVVQKWLNLPTTVIENNGELVPIYPTPSKSRVIAYNQSAINNALNSISEGIENKSNFTVSNVAIVEVLSIDENLSRYYASTLEDNRYTVRVNEMDYSNVEGGFGLFGCLNKSEKTILIQSNYISSFGYNVLFEN